MKFYNREHEIQVLHNTQLMAEKSAQMTFIIGRRRIGKTKLILNAFDEKLVYWFVSKKSEALLCAEFIEQLKTSLNMPVFGEFSRFSQLFEFVLNYACTHSFTLSIDEFQNFFAINPSIYSDIQNLWDRYKDRTKLNLILCGSIYSLMNRIFEDAKEPLYGRANRKLIIKPFTIKTLKFILNDVTNPLDAQSILDFYAITGGVAKYVELLVEHQAFSFNAIMDLMLCHGSIFIHEGRDVLIEEFGKDHAQYFSILSLIANSKTSRSEIESILGKSVGGHLERLEHDFGIIKVVKPILSKPLGKTQKYRIEDHFLNFWFRFIYKYQSAMEIENYAYVKAIIQADWSTFVGRVLETYFIEVFKESKQYNIIGQYWERDNQNELDLVAINEREKRAVIAEVKLNPKRINQAILPQKAARLTAMLSDYDISYQGLSLKDLR